MRCNPPQLLAIADQPRGPDDRQPYPPSQPLRHHATSGRVAATTGYDRDMSHGLHHRRTDHLRDYNASERHRYDPHRTSRIVDEEGAEEAYYPDGMLAWRRILRRRTTDVAPRSTASAGSGSTDPGLIGSAVMVQVFAAILIGGLLIGDAWIGPGRGGAIGYLVGSGVLTLIFWRCGKSS